MERATDQRNRAPSGLRLRGGYGARGEEGPTLLPAVQILHARKPARSPERAAAEDGGRGLHPAGGGAGGEVGGGTRQLCDCGAWVRILSSGQARRRSRVHLR